MNVRGAGLVVVAAGVGHRLRGTVHKALVELDGTSLVEHTLRRLLAAECFEAAVLVGHPDDRATLEALVEALPRPVQLVDGGARRQDSVAAGLAALATGRATCDVVLVHDAARPFVPLDRLDELVTEARAHGCALLAVPVADTLKEVRVGAGSDHLPGAAPAEASTDTAPVVARTVPRVGLWAAQTPQAFRCAELADLLASAQEQGRTVTDEAALFEDAGRGVRIVEGSRVNFKVTTHEDLELARALVARGKQADSEHT